VPEGAAGAGETWRAPTWRRDVDREIDLVEEIGRIEGYDRVPEDVAIAARPVELSARERTVRRAGEVLVGAGFCEAMTRSVVSAALEAASSPWGDAAPLVIEPALVRGADRLRRSLVPSLLEALADNVAAGNHDAELFEVARAYLARPAGTSAAEPVEEPLLVALVGRGLFPRAKGLVEAVLAGLGLDDRAAADARIVYRPLDWGLLAAGRAAEVVLVRRGGIEERVGVLGEVAAATLAGLSLTGPVAVAEVRLDRLEFAAGRERPLVRPSEYPAVQRDVNLVVAAEVSWGDVAAAIRAGGGPLLEECRLVEEWRDAERLGAGRKSFVVALRLRSATATLTGEEANRLVDAVVAECGRRVGAALRG